MSEENLFPKKSRWNEDERTEDDGIGDPPEWAISKMRKQRERFLADQYNKIQFRPAESFKELVK